MIYKKVSAIKVVKLLFYSNLDKLINLTNKSFKLRFFRFLYTKITNYAEKVLGGIKILSKLSI